MLEHDSAARERLVAEVRNARTISHPNVCRVYDMGEVQGRSFLTMEYIDGEDPASLLRRIGRLPAPKALEIATVGAALHDTPLTFDLTRWYAWRTLVVAALIVGLATWGFRNVLGRQSAFPGGLLEQ